MSSRTLIGNGWAGLKQAGFFMIEIRIDGIEPAPQGSKVRTRYGMREASERVAPWRDAVRSEALAATTALIESACRVDVEFRFRRPEGHYAASGKLRPSARLHYTVKRNDIDKCCRSTLDGLTGSALAEDCLVVELVARQRYCERDERPGALVTIQELI